jgi:NAD(P)-dependent dehydrogenase (short-subunit alcohol dehydrogenase family)
MDQLPKKFLVVTGANSGIGYATVEAVLSKDLGYNII